jgi:hypothetical protein
MDLENNFPFAYPYVMLVTEFIHILFLQFISQRYKPIRGRAIEMLIKYIRNYPCKVCKNIILQVLCLAIFLFHVNMRGSSIVGISHA